MEVDLTSDTNTTGPDAAAIAQLAREAMLSRKGEDVVVLDVRGQSSVTDFYVIASGSAAPHLKAMLSEIQHALKLAGAPPGRRSGQPDDGWVVLDCYDVVMHMLLKDLREYYAIEELWAGAPRVD
jgi:ribosome-associated protein